MLGLIACSGRKRNIPLPSRKLYIGNLFVMSRRYCESKQINYMVLSGQYGLLHKNKIIAPYNRSLKEFTKEELKNWYIQTAKQIDEIEDTTLLLFGGRLYSNIIPYVKDKKIIDLFKKWNIGDFPGRGNIQLNLAKGAPCDL